MASVVATTLGDLKIAGWASRIGTLLVTDLTTSAASIVIDKICFKASPVGFNSNGCGGTSAGRCRTSSGVNDIRTSSRGGKGRAGSTRNRIRIFHIIAGHRCAFNTTVHSIDDSWVARAGGRSVIAGRSPSLASSTGSKDRQNQDQRHELLLLKRRKKKERDKLEIEKINKISIKKKSKILINREELWNEFQRGRNVRILNTKEKI
jgi:hypothetical protein